jgi:hypothetical protein
MLILEPLSRAEGGSRRTWRLEMQDGERQKILTASEGRLTDMRRYL